MSKEGVNERCRDNTAGKRRDDYPRSFVFFIEECTSPFANSRDNMTYEQMHTITLNEPVTRLVMIFKSNLRKIEDAIKRKEKIDTVKPIRPVVFRHMKGEN